MRGGEEESKRGQALEKKSRREGPGESGEGRREGEMERRLGGGEEERTRGGEEERSRRGEE